MDRAFLDQFDVACEDVIEALRRKHEARKNRDKALAAYEKEHQDALEKYNELADKIDKNKDE